MRIASRAVVTRIVLGIVVALLFDNILRNGKGLKSFSAETYLNTLVENEHHGTPPPNTTTASKEGAEIKELKLETNTSSVTTASPTALPTASPTVLPTTSPTTLPTATPTSAPIGTIVESILHSKNISKTILPETMIRPALELTTDDYEFMNATGVSCASPIMKRIRSQIRNTQNRCCIGATSNGGQQYVAGDPKVCIRNRETFDKLWTTVQEELQKFPVVAATLHEKSNANPYYLGCDICRIIQLVSSLKHSRIAIVGASVQMQSFFGLECELKRRGFELSAPVLDKSWENDPDDTPPNRVSWKYGVKHSTCFHVSLPQWMIDNNDTIGNPNRRHGHKTVEICAYNHYVPYPGMDQHKRITEMSDVMIVDYGLHFLPMYGGRAAGLYLPEYRDNLQFMMAMFKNTTHNCHLMFRETTAQHFDFPGGHFIQTQKHKKTCVPHFSDETKFAKDFYVTDGLPVRTWLLFRAAESQGFTVRDPIGNLLSAPNATNQTTTSSEAGNSTSSHRGSGHNHNHEITFLPFHNFTSQLWYLHPHGKDCTHFCYSPHIWYPIWRHLRNALERLVAMA